MESTVVSTLLGDWFLFIDFNYVIPTWNKDDDDNNNNSNSNNKNNKHYALCKGIQFTFKTFIQY